MPVNKQIQDQKVELPIQGTSKDYTALPHTWQQGLSKDF